MVKDNRWNLKIIIPVCMKYYHWSGYQEYTHLLSLVYILYVLKLRVRLCLKRSDLLSVCTVFGIVYLTNNITWHCNCNRCSVISTFPMCWTIYLNDMFCRTLNKHHTNFKRSDITSSSTFNLQWDCGWYVH
jgi:hypothetical protein